MNLLDLIPGVSYVKLIPYVVGGVAVLGVGLYAWHIYAEAAKVPQLEQAITQKQAQIDYTYGRIHVIGNQLVQVQKDRDKSHDDLIAAYGTIDDMTKDLDNAKKNSPSANNATCVPTDVERQLFNNATRNIQQQFK